MLTREQFKEYMLKAKELEEISNKLTINFKLLSSMNEFFLEKPFTDIISLLKIVMDDQYGDIDYFIYELDWGTNAKKDSITEEDGTPIPMFTLDDLYNKLITEKELRGE